MYFLVHISVYLYADYLGVGLLGHWVCVNFLLLLLNIVKLVPNWFYRPRHPKQ